LLVTEHVDPKDAVPNEDREEPKRTKFRTETELPTQAKSNTDMFPPTRLVNLVDNAPPTLKPAPTVMLLPACTKERTLRELDKFTHSMTDNFDKLPNRTKPAALTLEPTRTKFRREYELPMVAKFKTERLEPQRTVDRSDTELPR
jgi:hypothetical protein